MDPEVPGVSNTGHQVQHCSQSHTAHEDNKHFIVLQVSFQPSHLLNEASA